ncbi:restriction endonuclease subunit S [Glaesserella parasuis]|nr:restriction endonuclease subunit S [Glaesserella parasuis]MDO9996623.1 restriction endonuclease subunit S [Glaesserella parasuis]MDP0013518.1 restriction endonuclease subunit S [Glaesserella parasuis]MDP0045404.1 restriction endonuclease subunit S [Glaesserella parasuis]MDP0136873.1 restriction endonuclease subunit S [Glaesserella parasuis]
MNASEQNKPNQQERVIPKLRFPEFQTALGWSWKTLDQVCTITNGKSNAQDHIENGKYPLFDRSEIIKASNDYLFDCEVVIIPGEGMKFIPKYYKGKFNLHQRAYALKDFIINGKFVYYSMLNNTTLLSKKAVQSTVLSLRLPILKNFPIIKPETEEQQKIADCLSSLDELIELQEQKLVALKQHKKGLMQQLFPSHNDLQASKIVYPKLRFPQFKNCEGWDVVELRDVGYFVKEKMEVINLEPPNYISTENLLSDYGGVTASNKLPTTEKVTAYKKNDILVSNIRPYLKKVWQADKNGGASNDIIIIRAKPSINISFLSFAIKNDDFIDYMMKGAKGVKMPRGDLNLISIFPVAVPTSPKEQQAIADCLSSLDNLINEQNERIGRLKTHKKGLMQQLFPNI